MKIEKVSDNQIRCTLNKSDLIDRELRISELAYGTEKAKALFRDMIQQAFYEFGFEVDDIEAIRKSLLEFGVEVSKIQQMGWGGGFDTNDLWSSFNNISTRLICLSKLD